MPYPPEILPLFGTSSTTIGSSAKKERKKKEENQKQHQNGAEISQ
jgi:hypothetical protein